MSFDTSVRAVPECT